MTALGGGPGKGFNHFTEDEEQRVEELQGLFNAAYGTDGSHWYAAKVLVGSGVYDMLIERGRAEALAPDPEPVMEPDPRAPICQTCQKPMREVGSVWLCESCGSTQFR